MRDEPFGEYELEFDDFEAEYDDEFEIFDEGEAFDEEEEMELAMELLSVSDEEELEQFLGKLIKKAGRSVGKFAKSSAGRALGGILKKAAKAALPTLGRAAGTFFGGPAGGAIGAKLASSAGSLFGLELEGLSPEDQEFEVARRFVRFAGAAAKKTANSPNSAPAAQVATAAVKSAARKHAPGLAKTASTSTSFGGSRRSGRWIRRGRKIILLGA